MDMKMEHVRSLPHPDEIKEQYPLSPELAELKAKRDEEIQDILTGRSNRILMIIGPCSADSEEPVLDYISRLVRVQDEVKDKILIIPQIGRAHV